MSIFPGLDAEIDAALGQILEAINNLAASNQKGFHQMALNFSALQTAVAQIKADTAKNATDIAAVIAALQNMPVNNDPANQAIIDQAVSDLGGVQTSLEATNKSAEAAIPATTPTPPPTP